MKITLLYKHIAHDVEQLTLRYAESRIAEPEAKDLAEFGKSESDQQLIMRYCMTGTAKLRKILKDYITLMAVDADDKLPADRASWSFILNNGLGDGESLAGLMHWFVVKFCLWEWAKAFSPNDANATKAELDAAETDIDDMLAETDMPIKERTPRYTEVDEVEIIYGQSN